jgi:hypothetical protein
VKPSTSPIALAQQQRAGLAGQLAAVETGHNIASFDGCKME